MVLESLMNPFTAEKKPWEMLFIGFLYSSVAVFLSLWIFRSYASLVMVFLTVMAAIPLIFSATQLEEEKDMREGKESVLLKEHGKALSFFVMLFIGFTLSFTLWYIVLPSDMTLSLFSVQSKTINEINTQITGGVIESLPLLSKIFFNNLKVLIFCLLFSFLYGAGAIFVLTWNASVIGTAIGNFIRSNISEASPVLHYFQIGSLGVLRYFIHGIPEILAYFVGGLAAGIISVGIIRHDFTSKKFRGVVVDSVDLVLLAVGLLFAAAIIEVYVTPVLF